MSCRITVMCRFILFHVLPGVQEPSSSGSSLIVFDTARCSQDICFPSVDVPSSYASFIYHRIIIVNSVCWSHALVNGPTSKRPASGGGGCSGQLLMMCQYVAYQ